MTETDKAAVNGHIGEDAPKKKLINEPRDCVDDSLQGFAACHSEVKKLRGLRILVRSDIDGFRKSNKVALLSGGGSGHEPMFAGFVGEGGLTAAVAGSVFTSPPPSQMMTGMRAIETQAGILVLIINYTGDRLNFGIAIERFEEMFNNTPIESLIIADDCAMKSRDRSAGRRGLAATVFVIKIGGSMSEAGMPLEKIHAELLEVTKNIGTIGLSLSSCSLPGKAPMFTLQDDQMELGLGVHGEPGVRRMPLQPARQAVETMLNHMTDPNSRTKIQFDAGDEIAVILNNLGGMTLLEMNIVSKEVANYFTNKNIVIKRMYVGPFMTSLEMHGVSISVLKLQNDWLKHLDSDVKFSAWPSLSTCVTEDFEVDTSKCQVKPPISLERQASVNLVCRPESNVGQCLKTVCNDLISNENYLNKLDRFCGDGDCGSTIRRGALAILKALDEHRVHTEIPSKLFADLSLIVECSAGGTAGAIYSLLLSSAARALKGDDEFKASRWLEAYCAATDTIMTYASARRGDRTMVDPLAAGCDFAKAQKDRIVDAAYLTELKLVIEKSAQSTKDMKSARAGRASYVAESNLTHPDPGAVGVSIWMQSLIGFVLSHDTL